MSEYDTKSENDQAADWLLNYQQKKIMYIEAVESMQEFSPLVATNYSGMPKGMVTSNPSQDKGMVLINFGLRKPELELQRKWLITIDDTEKTLSEKKMVYLELRRRAVNIEPNRIRPSWVDYVQAKFADWHYRQYQKEFVPCKQSMVDWWNDIINVTVRIAIRRGAL